MSDDLIKRLESVEIAAVRANRELLGTKPVTQVNADVKEAATRIRELEAAQGVAVKPLEWRDNPDKGEGGLLADGIFGVVYHVQGDAWSLHRRMHWEEAEGTEAAKAAAQADYDRRILPALSPAPVTVSEAARVLLERIPCDEDAIDNVQRYARFADFLDALRAIQERNDHE